LSALTSLALAFTLALGAAAARPETADQEVERLGREAIKLYKAGSYDKSIELLVRAYAIRPLAPLLYNLAKAYDKKKDLENACASWRKYVEAPGADPKLSKKAEERLTTCKAPEKPPEPEPAPPPTPKPVEPAPPAPAPTPAPVAPAPAVTQTASAPPPNAGHQGAWLGLGVSAAVLGVGGLGAGVGLWAAADTAHQRFVASTDAGQKRSLRATGQMRADLSTALYSVGGALAVASIPLLYLGLRHEEAASPKAVFVPLLGPSGVGGSVSCQF